MVIYPVGGTLETGYVLTRTIFDAGGRTTATLGGGGQRGHDLLRL